MAPTPIKTNRELVKSFWKQNVRNAKEISKKKKLGFLYVLVSVMFPYFEKMVNCPKFIDLADHENYLRNNVAKLK